ncbi:MAG TPA: hypothetical protein PK641_01690 [Candidatus Enterocola sp.]|nr:hypothetical protein [Candidatus Enterocola sp.]
MKKHFLREFLLAVGMVVASQTTITSQTAQLLRVEGDGDKFYPVAFDDSKWDSSMRTILEINRFSTHLDSSWKGALCARFEYHLTRGGNGANFINADVHQSVVNVNPAEFVAGWQDISGNSGQAKMLVWLKGNTSYYYVSNGAQSPLVYDGVQNPLPLTFGEWGEPVSYTYKTTIDESVVDGASMVYNSLRIGTIGDPGNLNVPLNAQAAQYNIDFTGYRDCTPDQVGARIAAKRINRHQENAALIQKTGLAFYTNPDGWNGGDVDLQERMCISPDGKVGIGTSLPDHLLTVNGIIHAKEILIELSGPLADYVFDSTYVLMPLKEVNEYVKSHKHLPDMPSAADAVSSGISVGDMQNKLLQKVEELTLHAIRQQEEIDALKNELRNMTQTR